jgi:ubiquinone biosynthesis protein UbiJ
MATQSPFSFLNGLMERVMAGPQPPQWLVSEVHQRIVLFLNHVLMQEKEATDRLVRQKGRVARVQWRSYSMALQVTPAGLFNVAPEGAQPDLLLEVTETSPLALAQVALRGDKPSIRTTIHSLNQCFWHTGCWISQ